MTQRVFTAASTLHYPGDVRHIVGEIKGPNTLGEFYRATRAEYDGERTTVTFELLRLDREAA